MTAPQVTLFVYKQVPNPLKVAILLEELGIEYDTVEKEFNDGTNGVRNPEFVKINPNCRLPALIDHTNDDYVVWESGAIMLYVAERFDTTQKLVGSTLEERSEVWQWLMFQMSGIGPMHCQFFWFDRYHPVRDLDPSVVERFRNETDRVYGVLEKRLEEHGEWVAIKRFTIVDIANFPWIHLYVDNPTALKYPHLEAYHKRIESLASVQRAYSKICPCK